MGLWMLFCGNGVKQEQDHGLEVQGFGGARANGLIQRVEGSGMGLVQ